MYYIMFTYIRAVLLFMVYFIVCFFTSAIGYMLVVKKKKITMNQLWGFITFYNIIILSLLMYIAIKLN